MKSRYELVIFVIQIQNKRRPRFRTGIFLAFHSEMEVSPEEALY
jgi:hypothetical protein